MTGAVAPEMTGKLLYHELRGATRGKDPRTPALTGRAFSLYGTEPPRSIATTVFPSNPLVLWPEANAPA
ncbi:hypothetical protein SMA5143A_7876 [Streptomyces sp. MA5143a]|nr:hypothetical protein SMA5143A_7876 [Streptomyces sp. MA5143a]